jgi:histidyl-tRNA synthetase
MIKDSPDVVSFFSEETRSYFERVCATLDGVGIEYEIDPRLVRGLDYYAHTVFEVTHSGLGAQSALAGGGRYEVSLPESKKPVIGVGFAAGMERLLMARESLGLGIPESPLKTVFLVGLGEKARDLNMTLAAKLRSEDIPVVAEVEVKSMKAQMRAANRLNASYVVICGDSELEKGVVVCKNMENGEQLELAPEKLSEYLKSLSS